jgi:hypothetical protein
VLNEAGVGGQDDAACLEGEPVRVFAGGKLALLNGNGCEAADQSRAALLHDCCHGIDKIEGELLSGAAAPSQRYPL